MSDFVLIPHTDYGTLCDELRTLLPKSVQVLNLLLCITAAEPETKCYAKLNGGKPDPRFIIVKLRDVKFQKVFHLNETKIKRNLRKLLQFDLEQDFFLFITSEESIPKFLECKLILDCKKLTRFRGIDVDHLGSLNMACRRHSGHLRLADTGYIIYKLDSPNKLTTSLPSDVELGPITDEAHIHMIRISWLYRELMTLEEFKHEMLSSMSVGLYIRTYRHQGSHHYADTSRHLVSWAVCDIYGSITLISTVAEHQHKGYAVLVLSDLCTKLLAAGRIPMAEVDERQTSKKKLFEDLGFRAVCRTKTGYHVPDDNPIELDKFNKMTYEVQRIDGRVFKPVTTTTPHEEQRKGISITL